MTKFNLCKNKTVLFGIPIEEHIEYFSIYYETLIHQQTNTTTKMILLPIKLFNNLCFKIELR